MWELFLQSIINDTPNLTLQLHHLPPSLPSTRRLCTSRSGHSASNPISKHLPRAPTGKKVSWLVSLESGSEQVAWNIPRFARTSNLPNSSFEQDRYLLDELPNKLPTRKRKFLPSLQNLDLNLTTLNHYNQKTLLPKPEYNRKAPDSGFRATRRHSCNDQSRIVFACVGKHDKAASSYILQ